MTYTATQDAPAAEQRVANFFAEGAARPARRERPAVSVAAAPLLEANPSFAAPTCDLVRFCDRERSFAEAVEHLAAGPWPKTFVAQPDAFASLLCDHGLLSLHVYVDGEPYAGTPDDLVDDEAVGPDAAVSYGLRATDEGRAVAAGLAPRAQLRRLIDEDPASAPAHLRVLELASAPEGRSRDAIAAALRAEGLVPVDERTGLPRVFPTYYIDNLERAGGLLWESTWKTTREGRDLLEEERDR
ncbi:MAG: hypothetical protein HFJ75_05755 [Eggerthellaceae bacterium]|nr:hypothetical protein [Eggerthellaceae bacterium]